MTTDAAFATFLLRNPRAPEHPGYHAFCRGLHGRTYSTEMLDSAWESFKIGWEGNGDPSSLSIRHLTPDERRRIAHALRQLAEATLRTFSSIPPEMAAAEADRLRSLIRTEVEDHDRLAGEIERNGLQFTGPATESDSTAKEDVR